MKRELPDQLKFITNRRAIQKTTDASMRGKVCVVSGSTSGVGREAVRRLARGGADTVLVCRNREKAETVRGELISAYGVSVDIVTADFSDLETVRAAAGMLLKSCPRIDVLINSAGMHSTTRTTTGAGLETVFCVNHLASFLLTSLLFDRMKESAPSRIIQVNSEGHRFATFDLDDIGWERNHYTGLRSYGSSKTAQLLSVWEMADRLAGTGVTINAMHPGEVRTNIGNNNGLLYRLFKRTVLWPMLRDPAISGEALYYLAAAPELAGVSGRYFNLTMEEKPEGYALDRELGRRAWDLSRALTGLAPKELSPGP